MGAIGRTVFLVAVIAHSCQSVGQKPTIQKNGPSDKTLDERGLITTSPKIKDVIRENEAYTVSQSTIKHTNGNVFSKVMTKNQVIDRIGNASGSVLAYVTPWNANGYRIAKLFANKFTHICPVWLQLKMNEDHESTRIEGTHDIDYGWMKVRI